MTHGTMLGIEATRSGTRPTPNYPGPPPKAEPAGGVNGVGASPTMREDP
jgi:hypothetical protein